MDLNLVITGSWNEEDLKRFESYKTLNAIFYFDPELDVTKECIGKEFPIRINDVEGILCMPKFPNTFPEIDGNLMPPKDCYDKENYWGLVLNPSLGNSRVRSCFLQLIRSGSTMNIRDTMSSMTAWHQLFLENVSILSGIYVRQGRKVQSIDLRGPKVFKLFDEGHEIHDYPEVTLSIKDQSKPYGIGYDVLKEAIELTSISKRYVLEYYFLLDSWEAFLNENFRKCVLDAATAVEIALNNVLKKKLPVEEHFKNTILSKYDSLRSKRALCKELGIGLPKFRYDIDFEKVRNKTIHIGYDPSPEEAEKVIQIAESILKEILIEKYEQIN
jgi:hypothetical protein